MIWLFAHQAPVLVAWNREGQRLSPLPSPAHMPLAPAQSPCLRHRPCTRERPEPRRALTCPARRGLPRWLCSPGGLGSALPARPGKTSLSPRSMWAARLWPPHRGLAGRVPAMSPFLGRVSVFSVQFVNSRGNNAGFALYHHDCNALTVPF